MSHPAHGAERAAEEIIALLEGRAEALPEAESATPPTPDLRDLLRQCIGLLMACEDVFRRDVANHIAQGLPDTIDHELRTHLVDSCAEWLPLARQAHQRLQIDAQAMAALRRQEVAP